MTHPSRTLLAHQLPGQAEVAAVAVDVVVAVVADGDAVGREDRHRFSIDSYIYTSA